MRPPSQDEAFMHRALSLARNTIGLASPNPQVGCVLTRETADGGDAEIIGEGAHLYDNRDHAEIVALKQAAQRGISPRGATAYVTLEPCSHHGRTGPCADALVAAGIARCVIATQDPNPQVSGQGMAKLRAASIDITLGPLQQLARDLNEAFAHFIQRRAPFVTLKAALSVDGRLAPPPTSRLANQPHWLTGAAARHQVQLLRHASDAVLTGIGTVLADAPLLTDRSNVFGPDGQTRRRPLLRVILDTHLRTPLTSKLVRSANNDLLILCGHTAPAANIRALEDLGAEVAPIPDNGGHLSLKTALSILAGRNLLSVLLECGSHLNGAFLAQHLVDKAILFYTETELGDQAIPFAHGIPSPYLFQQSLTRVTQTSYGPDACVTGYLHDPWASSLPAATTNPIS
jgi:diaminohydroxyphosphoribosylaminopyrimidine deaminase / 5-amino-6-(5-phosphoribosylamino)uracil reductase